MKITTFFFTTAVLLAAAILTSLPAPQSPRWPEQQANAWYAQQPWLVGSNYMPKSAINQLDNHDPATVPAQTANSFRINTSTPTSQLLILNHLQKH